MAILAAALAYYWGLAGRSAKAHGGREVSRTKGSSSDTVPKCPRVGARPNPEDWGMDELLTLPEAAELCWPEGPLTVTSLRTAVRHRQLAVAVVAGKFLTTRRQLAKMASCQILGAAETPEIAAKNGRLLSTGEARTLLDSELERLRHPRNPHPR